MSMTFFSSVLKALGKRLNFESVSNLYGNSFAKDAGKHIQEAHPLMKVSKNRGFFDMIASQAQVVTLDKKDTSKSIAQVSQDMGSDLSWAEGLF